MGPRGEGRRLEIRYEGLLSPKKVKHNKRVVGTEGQGGDCDYYGP